MSLQSLMKSVPHLASLHNVAKLEILCTIGLFTSNFIVPYWKENTNDTECSLLDIESCQSRSDLQISNSFEKLR